MHWYYLIQVPSQCVESQSFTTPPVYSPGKQGTKTKICSVTNNLTELVDFEKVIIPKRQRNNKKSPDGNTGKERDGKCNLHLLIHQWKNLQLNVHVWKLYNVDNYINIDSFIHYYLAEQLKGKSPKLKCNYCDKVFSKNFDLQQHIRRWVNMPL